MKVLKEVGFKKLIRFFGEVLFKVFFNCLCFPPLRKIYLGFFGAKIGQNSVIHGIEFINLYRGRLKNLNLSKNCFLADGVMLDLADKIVLEDSVTLAARVAIFTHRNVGYKNHPLQKDFPSFTKAVIIKRGAFIGANAIILPGIKIGSKSFIAAGSVVTKDVDSKTLVGGVPAKLIRRL